MCTLPSTASRAVSHEVQQPSHARPGNPIKVRAPWSYNHLAKGRPLARQSFLIGSRWHFNHLPRVSSSCCTTRGSARVVRSPSSFSCLAAIFLSTLRMIFPERVFGRPARPDLPSERASLVEVETCFIPLYITLGGK
jgi:hypothetical protein